MLRGRMVRDGSCGGGGRVLLNNSASLGEWGGLGGGGLTAPTHPPSDPPPLFSDWAKFSPGLRPIKNHLEERLLDQAQARAAYTPLFWGHSRSIPQGIILDVQPLVKSLFCPIRPSPNGFFDSEASTP